jgi:putative endonuclease
MACKRSGVRLPLAPPAFAPQAFGFRRFGSVNQLEARRLPSRSCTATQAGYARYVIYVYILESEIGGHFYVGVTADIDSRLAKHNAREVPHTAKYAPWSLKNFFAFSDEAKAYSFEKYLKSGSGRAFAKRYF